MTVVLLNDLPMRNETTPLQGINLSGLNTVKLNVFPKFIEDKKERTAVFKTIRKDLQKTLSDLAPRMIIPLGPFGIKACLNTSGLPNFANYRGSISVVKWAENKPVDVTKYKATYPVDADKTFICPILSPWFVRRAPEWTEISQRDIDRMHRVLNEGWVPYEYREGVDLLQATSDLDYLGLDFNSTVALDIETTEEPPHLAKLICLVISDKTKSLVIPYSRTLDGRSEYWSHIEYFRNKLNRFLLDHTAVTHNGMAFDHLVLHRYGVRIPHWEDTIIAAHVLEGHMRKNLFEACSRYLDVWPWKQHSHDTMDELIAYNHTDGVNTIRLWHEIKEHVS